MPTGVIGIVLLPPLVLVEEFLRHVPLLHRWIQRVEKYPRPSRVVKNLPATAHAQARAEIFLCGEIFHHRSQHQDRHRTGAETPNYVHKYPPLMSNSGPNCCLYQ